MGNRSPEKMQNRDRQTGGALVIATLAHVDAGKTTLTESILYHTGVVRKAGRVDHGDAFLDTQELEKARGITIFSKQAVFPLGEYTVTLLDTPGHVDFSAETERVIRVLDYAVVVISGMDGVQGHTLTLWELLAKHGIPVFLFVNKMDQSMRTHGEILQELKAEFGDGVLNFNCAEDSEEFQENLALFDEQLMERYLENRRIGPEEIAELIGSRRLFPCFFGSALKHEGVRDFLDGLERYVRCPVRSSQFGARIFKIDRDTLGNRLTHLKVTGGELKVKTIPDGAGPKGEKIDQIRIYSGSRFTTVDKVRAGTVCAVTGLSDTRCGQGFGFEADCYEAELTPVLTYRMTLPPDCDVHRVLPVLMLLEEEDPQLHIVWNSQLEEVHVHVMGDVQVEILKELIASRFGIAVEFDAGSIVYRETITRTVEGVGHFEPLRHYAEVHLVMEPMPSGSGIVLQTDCSEDDLALNWQRLILTHLAEREYPGVLTGAPVTDLRITVAGGRAHQKHTEGGDFRQATYRAVRQGLMEAGCVLLEPWYSFRLEVPDDQVGRAMADVQRMAGSFDPPRIDRGRTILTGSAPVSEMRNYQAEVVSYTRGRGKLTCAVRGYEPCHNAAELIEASGYDPERDTENPADSVFCAHGAGYSVPWYEVKEHMHVPSVLKNGERKNQDPAVQASPERKTSFEEMENTDKELEAIFERTYGPVRRRAFQETAGCVPSAPARRTPVRVRKKKKPEESFLLVDGYNIIFAWERLKDLAGQNIDSARDRLMDILSNYQGYVQCTLILVFDAYRVQGHAEEVIRYHNIYVVYTKEAETADQYIERTVHRMGRQWDVTVATSDGLEQVIIQGEGGRLISAREFAEEIAYVNQEIRREIQEDHVSGRNYLFSCLDEDLLEEIERIRTGKEEETK